MSSDAEGHRARRRRARTWFVALSMAGYTITSHALGEQYPFSPLSMFSVAKRAAGHVIARTEDGRACELSSFRGWDCPGGVDLAARRPGCFSGGAHPENDRKATRYIHDHGRHGGAVEEGAAPVEVVRRVFNVPQAGGRVVAQDCSIAKCTAVEVPGTCQSTP